MIGVVLKSTLKQVSGEERLHSRISAYQDWHSLEKTGQQKHRPALLELFTQLMSSDRPVLGLLLNEVGNMRHLLNETATRRLEEVIENAFESASVEEHGPPNIIWSQGETMAIFKTEMDVRVLKTAQQRAQVDAWRVIETFELTGAAEHGPCSLLIYNIHQSTSDQRRFGVTLRIESSKAVLRHAIIYH